MSNSWLPPAVATGWTIVFVLILLVHLGHVVSSPGAHRAWHGGHVLMALGMIVMVVPTGSMAVSATGGAAVFAVAAVAAAGWVPTRRLLGHRVDPPWPVWVLSVLDLAWMAVMFVRMDGGGPAWPGVVGAGYFVLQALAWALGVLGRVVDRDRRVPTGATERPGAAVDGGSHDRPVRVTLTAMGLGMAYMMLATTFGMPAGHGPHVPGPMHDMHDMHAPGRPGRS